jgi:hypothetical protein
VAQDHFPYLWSALMCSSVLCVCRVLLVNCLHVVTNVKCFKALKYIRQIKSVPHEDGKERMNQD